MEWIVDPLAGFDQIMSGASAAISSCCSGRSFGSMPCQFYGSCDCSGGLIIRPQSR
jgi:hypothetical protein